VPPSIAINQFEGPLGLLLELVERNKMPVTDIAVATITSQYLEHLAKLPDVTPEALGDFIQLGSRLTYIKSLALLPSAEPSEQAEELRILGVELSEYQRFQKAAARLAERDAGAHWTRPQSQQLAPVDLPLPQVTLPDLAAAFQAALRRVEPEIKPRAIAHVLSQRDVIAGLRQRLTRGSFELEELLATLTSRLEVVVTFSALLEIMREGQARVTQASQFSPILVEASNE
jgi:segregation and condensation protein A